MAPSGGTPKAWYPPLRRADRTGLVVPGFFGLHIAVTGELTTISPDNGQSLSRLRARSTARMSWPMSSFAHDRCSSLAGHTAWLDDAYLPGTLSAIAPGKGQLRGRRSGRGSRMK